MTLIRRVDYLRGRAGSRSFKLFGHQFEEAALHTVLLEEGFSDLQHPAGAHAFLREMFNLLANLQFPLQVYRGLNLGEGEKPDPHRCAQTGAGAWWTWNAEVAKTFAWGNHQSSEAYGDVPWLLEATVAAPSEVNWPGSVEQYLRFSAPDAPPHEQMTRSSSGKAARRASNGPNVSFELAHHRPPGRLMR